MPYPGEHAAIINDPDKYVEFRRENDKFGEGIHVIWGIKEDGSAEVQSIRFDADKFTVEEAKRWLEEHDFKPIEFEPAKEEEPDDGEVTTATGTMLVLAAADGVHVTGIAYSGGKMNLAGWNHPVVVDLSGLTIPEKVPLLANHENRTSSRLGVVTASVKDGALVVEGSILSTSNQAKGIVDQVKAGAEWQLSIGVEVFDAVFVRQGHAVPVNGQMYDGPFYHIRKSVLREVSVVAVGADASTSMRLAAMLNLIRSSNMSGTSNVKTADPAAPATAEPNVQLTLDQQIRAEKERILAIREICAGKFPKIEAKAIAEKWDVSRVALEVMRQDRPKAPVVHVRTSDLPVGKVLEAACMLTGKARDVEKMYDEPVLETASQRFRGGIGLQELLLEAAWANGYTGRNFRDYRTVLQYAFGHKAEAAFSTVNISEILTTVSNKYLLDGFYSVERTWRNICAVRNVPDFKTVESYRLIGNDQYELVAPGGELKHGTLGTEKFTNKADTYGLILTIDRQDIINDDLGAITTVPWKLGRGSGLKINDLFWTKFMNNASFFTTDRGNYVSGANTVLGIDGLTLAEQMFMDMKDSDGKPTGIMPSILLVPTSLSALGAQLYKSTEIRDTSSSVRYPVTNPHAGKFRVEVSRYLNNSSYSGHSSKAWYLLASPDDLPVIEVAFLNGQESPTIETADVNFSQLGIQMRGYHDFGVALQDYRGGVKMKGEA